jgi:hypothetical protein
MLPTTPADWSTFVTICLLVLIFWAWISTSGRKKTQNRGQRPPHRNPSAHPGASPVVTHQLVNFDAGDRVVLFIPTDLSREQAEAINENLQFWVRGDPPTLVLSTGCTLEVVRGTKGEPGVAVIGTGHG